MLFIGNNATCESAGVPIGDDPMPCEGPVGDDVDLESRMDF